MNYSRRSHRKQYIHVMLGDLEVRCVSCVKPSSPHGDAYLILSFCDIIAIIFLYVYVCKRKSAYSTKRFRLRHFQRKHSCKSKHTDTPRANTYRQPKTTHDVLSYSNTRRKKNRDGRSQIKADNASTSQSRIHSQPHKRTRNTKKELQNSNKRCQV